MLNMGEMNVKSKTYQVHVMRIAEPTVVCETTFSSKFAMMSEGAVDVAAVVSCLASDGACLMLQHQGLAGAQALAVRVVAVFGSAAMPGEMVAVAALSRLFGAS